MIDILKAGGSVAILGHASTTGSSDYDYNLAGDRANEVLEFLGKEAGGRFAVKKIDSRGKSTALAITGKNNTEDKEWRTVWVRVWTKDAAPKEIGLPNRLGVPLPVHPAISTANDAINIAGGVLSIMDLGIVFGNRAVRNARLAVGLFLPPTGLIQWGS